MIPVSIGLVATWYCFQQNHCNIFLYFFIFPFNRGVLSPVSEGHTQLPPDTKDNFSPKKGGSKVGVKKTLNTPTLYLASWLFTFKNWHFCQIFLFFVSKDWFISPIHPSSFNTNSLVVFERILGKASIMELQ